MFGLDIVEIMMIIRRSYEPAQDHLLHVLHVSFQHMRSLLLQREDGGRGRERERVRWAGCMVGWLCPFVETRVGFG
jgi:hypothetical protein